MTARDDAASSPSPPSSMQAELCGLRMQLVNLKRCAAPSPREAELQESSRMQQELNRRLMDACSRAQQHERGMGVSVADSNNLLLSQPGPAAPGGRGLGLHVAYVVPAGVLCACWQH